MFNAKKRWLRIYWLRIKRRHLIMKIASINQDVLNFMHKNSTNHSSNVSARLNDKYLSKLEARVIKVGVRCDEVQRQLNALGYFSYK